MTRGIPTESECFALLAEADLHPSIVRHSIGVRDVALQIADKLEAVGHPVDKSLVAASALLHDIMKINAEFDHAIEAGDLLRQKGFHEVASVVEKHALNNLSDPSFVPKTVEEKLIMYADLRFSSGRVVSLDERFDYIKRKYAPKNPNTFKSYMKFAKNLEKEFKDILESGGQSLDF